MMEGSVEEDVCSELYQFLDGLWLPKSNHQTESFMLTVRVAWNYVVQKFKRILKLHFALPFLA